MATHGLLRCLDPSELVSGVKKIVAPPSFPANNLIHLPDKLAGVFDSPGSCFVALNLVHLPGKLAGVGYLISLSWSLVGRRFASRPWYLVPGSHPTFLEQLITAAAGPARADRWACGP